MQIFNKTSVYTVKQTNVEFKAGLQFGKCQYLSKACHMTERNIWHFYRKTIVAVINTANLIHVSETCTV